MIVFRDPFFILLIRIFLSVASLDEEEVVSKVSIHDTQVASL